jgi:Acetoacetate decarboxylase (ADC)
MFRLQDGFSYSMPAHFGGSRFNPEFVLTQKATGLSVSYETDRARLESYIPEGFELLAPEVTVAFSKFTEINWMAGGYYNVINVSAPVRFHGKKDQLDGDYTLVVWENTTRPIFGGREETGIPKIYADIEDLHIVRPYYSTNASYDGNTFLAMNFESTGPLSGREFDAVKAHMASLNTIGWRYFPKVGAPGAELSQFVLYPQGVEVESAQRGRGSLRWMEQTIAQNPSQYHIINSLASLPVKKVAQAALTEGRAALHATGARVIE